LLPACRFVLCAENFARLPAAERKSAAPEKTPPIVWIHSVLSVSSLAKMREILRKRSARAADQSFQLFRCLPRVAQH
jgi:hypothetical protein